MAGVKWVGRGEGQEERGSLQQTECRASDGASPPATVSFCRALLRPARLPVITAHSLTVPMAFSNRTYRME